MRLRRAPHAELAAAALQAQQAARLEAADFIVVAVEPGEVGQVQRKIDAAIEGSEPTV